MTMSIHDPNDELKEKCENAVAELNDMGYQAEVGSVRMLEAKLKVKTWNDVVASTLADMGLKVDITYGVGHSLGSEYWTAVGVRLP